MEIALVIESFLKLRTLPKSSINKKESMDIKILRKKMITKTEICNTPNLMHSTTS